MILAERLWYLTLFFLPLYVWRFSLGGIPFNVLEFLIVVTLTVWIGYSPRQAWKDFSALLFSQRLIFTGIAMLLGGFLIGTLATGQLREGLGIMKGWLVLPLFFALAGHSLLTTQEKKQTALRVLFFSGVASALIAIILWGMGIQTFDGRVSLGYESPNMLAMYFGITFLAGFWNAPRTLWGGLACIALALVLTQSEGAAVGLAGALVSGFLYMHREMWKKLWITWVICAVLISFFAPLASFSSDPWQMGRTSLASRMMIWQVSLQTITQHWLAGIGPGAFQEVYLASQQQFPPFLEWAVPHPHNILLTVWLYGGILGLGGFVALLWARIYSLSNKKHKALALSLVSILLYILIHGSLDNVVWKNDLMVIFWMLILL